MDLCDCSLATETCHPLSTSAIASLMGTISDFYEPLPAFEAYQCNGNPPRSNQEALRLSWTLQDPLEDAIAMWTDNDAYEPILEQGEAGPRWHPLSNEPLTTPPVSSVQVHSFDLHRMLQEWVEVYNEHTCNEWIWNTTADEPSGEPNDYAESVYSSPLSCKLINSCGMDYPKELQKLDVHASDMPYVTVRDYIDTVHPWLMAQRDDLRRAMNVDELSPVPKESRLMVNAASPSVVAVLQQLEWDMYLKLRPLLSQAAAKSGGMDDKASKFQRAMEGMATHCEDNIDDKYIHDKIEQWLGAKLEDA